MAIEEPAWGQVRVANELKKQGKTVSAAGVRCVWLRHDLDTMKKRLNALEAKSFQERLVLTESQLAALEKAQEDKEGHGEFESECPGYYGARIRFMSGRLKGVGPDLSTDLHRYVQQGGLCQALRSQDSAYGCGHPQ
jgi:hypothetical protein